MARQRYKCEACGYKFWQDPNKFLRNKCPYCGKEGTVKTHTFSEADELLQEVSRVPNRYE
ncbi:MAG: hypothetical protein ACMXYA_00170 [Candidatus Woesearchaeota archaeon]